jgi:membrane-bound serine protease (ClpP class)
MSVANKGLIPQKGVNRLLVCLALVSMGLASDWLPVVRSAPAAAVQDESVVVGAKKTFVIPLNGVIESSMHGFLGRRIAEARKAGAQCIVLDIDSPGGRLDTTLEIVDLLRKTDDIEIVAYVRRQAISGAAVIALACQRIEMHPEAQLGDVGVIVAAPFSPYQYVPEKERSPVVAAIRTIAEATGRPAALAEAMVDKDITVYSATKKDGGELRYFTNKEWESLPDADLWQKGPPVFEARQNNFLTVNGTRAVELGLANGISRSLDATLDNLGALRPANVLAWTWIDTTVEILNSPLITWLLLIVGFGALLVELSSPGIGMGGLISLLCFSLFFWSRFLGGTSGWLEVVLFAVSLTFIAMELFVLPGFGVAGMTGIGLLILSLVMASRRVYVPHSSADWGDLGVTILTVVGALAAVMVGLFFAADYLGGVPLFKRLVLEPPAPMPLEGLLTDEGLKKSPNQSPWDRVAVGDLGRSISPLRPSGKALFGEDLLDVNTEANSLRWIDL